MYWSSYWTVDLAWWQGLWNTFLVWAISHWQPRCSLIRAAVTGACITNLSKRLSSTHPLSAECQHHGLSTHIFTCSETPLQDARAGEHVRTQAPHVYRHRSHYGDKSCLSWLPSVIHGVECCTSPTPPVICLSQMDLRGVQNPCLLAMTAGQFYFQTSHYLDGEETHRSLALWCKEGNSRTRGSG